MSINLAPAPAAAPWDQPGDQLHPHPTSRPSGQWIREAVQFADPDCGDFCWHHQRPDDGCGVNTRVMRWQPGMPILRFGQETHSHG
jgi:hypothetical protein